MYDSVGGRFVSRDPIGYRDEQWSFYRYVNSSPLRYTDWAGLSPLRREDGTGDGETARDEEGDGESGGERRS